ncbi:hypothetical protein D0867_06157 [Hortaea werneckii]|uniref:HIT-type domain-containing protein n=1 Tax=Hortaea werneckii TaxID=91943 RepID=A0A3M6ZPR0_HORWE|nr:hypothetical protein KC334_g1911 [Hortaea werneckii]KAI7010799.1 hypothetical protein KC355_g6020 [Hortaea werneckii]RMY17265.1 hypothetical protein D0867_06157 [Hortaea werneckii]RMY29301.1 hypothetical protein D0866_08794 [Hortaea werneckii]
MSTSTTPLLCGICTAQESKYKCPVCSLRYCSLACYKQHQPIHATASLSSAENPTQQQQQQQQQPTPPSTQQPKDRRPGTNNHHRNVPPKIDMTRFDSDPDFHSLLHRYPRLKIQLQALYALTLEPGPEEARTWSREPLPGDAVPTPGPGMNSRGRGGGRGGRRGGRGGGRGRGGSGGGGEATAAMEGGRQHGVWTVEKGEKEALGTMRKMRRRGTGNQGLQTSSGSDKAEGLQEFVELCMLRFGPESQREENERMVE